MTDDQFYDWLVETVELREDDDVPTITPSFQPGVIATIEFGLTTNPTDIFEIRRRDNNA